MVLEDLSGAFVALYLRGAPRPHHPSPIQAQAVGRVLRTGGLPALRRAGHFAEAELLEDVSLRAWADRLVAQGRCLTIDDPEYPSRWRRILGPRAPVALWREGDLPHGATPVAAVGSRLVPPGVAQWAVRLGEVVAHSGRILVSGGAIGCDSAAAEGARRCQGPVVEILPVGLARCAGAGGVRLSLCAPEEGFCRANAMERNALIYAFADLSVVCYARFKEGGTWHGALDAHRRRLTRLAVREDGSPAARALAALGARCLSDPAECLALGGEDEGLGFADEIFPCRRHA